MSTTEMGQGNMIKEEIAPGIMVYSNVIANSENLVSDLEEGMKSIGLPWAKAYVKSGDEIKIEESTRSTETSSEAIAMVQVRDAGCLDEGSGYRHEEKERYILLT